MPQVSRSSCSRGGDGHLHRLLSRGREFHGGPEAEAAASRWGPEASTDEALYIGTWRVPRDKKSWEDIASWGHVGVKAQRHEGVFKEQVLVQ